MKIEIRNWTLVLYPDKPGPKRFEDKKLITKTRKYEDTKA